MGDDDARDGRRRRRDARARRGREQGPRRRPGRGRGALGERGVQDLEEEHPVPVRSRRDARARVAVAHGAVAAGSSGYPDKDYASQKLILGTHTSEHEQNYLMIAEAQLPLESAEVDGREYDDESGEAGGFGSGGAKVKVVQHINHDGEVSRARYMPQNSFVLATKTV